MKIQILGTGCPKSRLLEANVRQAVEKKDIVADIIVVSDSKEIKQMGVVLTPALVIDGKVESPGKVLTIKQVQALL